MIMNSRDLKSQDPMLYLNKDVDRFILDFSIDHNISQI